MQADEQVQAESSPAAEVASEQVAPRTLESFSASERQEWLKTGEIPGAEKTADPATAKADKGIPPKAESATAKTPKEETEARFQELLRDRREARDERDNLRRRLEAVEQQQKPAEPVKAAEAPAAPKRPALKDFEDWETYEAARDQYTDDMADFKANQAIDQFKATTAKERQAEESAKVERETREQWEKQVTATKKEFSDFDEVAGNRDLPITGTMLYLMQDSDVGARMLYHLGQNPELAKEISEMHPLKVVKAMAKLEVKLSSGASETTSKAATPARDEKGLFAGAKPTTKASPPAKELSGAGGTQTDPSEAAVKNRDFASYLLHENAKDSMKRKQG